MKTIIYIAGSLKNWEVVTLTNELEKLGFDVFSEWLTPGPTADEHLLEYAKQRGWDYKQTLNSYAATHVFEFDKYHLDRADILILLMPAGKSAHTELGYFRGHGKPAYILFDTPPDRVDVMHKFASDIFLNRDELIQELKKYL